MKFKVAYFILLFLVLACKSSPVADFEKVDLLKYGIPTEVLAPKGSEINQDDLGIIQGVWIKSEGYYVQVYSSNSTTLNLQKLKAEKLEEVKQNRYFSKIVEEDDHGFIFEKDIDGAIRYDFRHIKVIGDKEVVFQRGLIGNYTEAEVRIMYESVQ